MTPAEDQIRTSRHLLVSGRIRSRRQTLGLTQKQVASRLGRLGVTSTNKLLSSLEHGAGVDVARLPELAEALECSVTWLLGLTEDPHAWEPDRPARPGSGRPRGGAAPGRVPSSTGRGARTGLRVSRTVSPERSAARRSWIIGPVGPNAGPDRP